MEYMHIYPSPVGTLTLTACEEGLTGLYLRRPSADEARFPDDAPCFNVVCRWLDDYFQGKSPDPLALPLCPRGSEFRLLIWKLLLGIPRGETRTYGDLAKDAARIMGKEKMSAQAVGGAVGSNPISIIIPCHRVVASGGKLGGFGWGSDTKIWLLRHEGGYYDYQ